MPNAVFYCLLSSIITRYTFRRIKRRLKPVEMSLTGIEKHTAIPKRSKANVGPFCKVCDKKWRTKKRNIHASVESMFMIHGFRLRDSIHYSTVCDKYYRKLQFVAHYILQDNALLIHIIRRSSNNSTKREKEILLYHGKIRHAVPRENYENAISLSFTKEIKGQENIDQVECGEGEELDIKHDLQLATT